MPRTGFNAIVNTGNPTQGQKGFITYRKQSSPKRFFEFVNKKFPQWKFVTCYRRTDNAKVIIKRSDQLAFSGDMKSLFPF